jgi:hypothetical protein
VTGYQNKDVGNVLSESVAGLSAGTIYFYRLRSSNDSGNSINSNIISMLTLPSEPIAISASNRDYSGFTANWQSVTGASGYYLDLSTDITFSSFVAGYQNKDVGNILSTSVIDLVTQTSYYYRLRAYNASGTSIDSNVIGVITKADYNDYFLPSKDEITAMANELYDYSVGDFTGGIYSSSSEVNSTLIWTYSFGTSSLGNGYKYTLLQLRACRKFTAAVGAYNVRDIGPAGGYIFYANAGEYLEAAPSDFVGSFAWSNIINVLIGTTDTIIGSGQDNTNEIINQAGHITSAALLCDQLTVTN